MTNNAKFLPPPESLNKNSVNEKNLGIINLGSDTLCAILPSFDVPLRELADIYIHNSTKFAAFHDPRFYRFDEQFVQKMYDPYDEFDKLFKRSFTEFWNEKFVTVSDEIKVD